MANIPLSDIPGTPKVDPTMPMPEGVSPNVTKLREIPGKLDTNTFNFTKFIPGLMQEGRDPRVAERNAAAIGQSIVGLGETLGQLGADLAKSKAISDTARAENIAREEWANYNIQADKENIPPGERLQGWEAEGGPQARIFARVEGLGLHPHTRSEVMPWLNNFALGKTSELSNQNYRYRIEQDREALNAKQQYDLADGNLIGANDAVDGKVNAKLITPQQGALEKQTNEGKYQEWVIEKDIARDPWMVLQEYEEWRTTGDSVYGTTGLNVNNPATWRKMEAAARSAYNHVKTELSDSISNQIIEGGITTNDQIAQAAGRTIDAHGQWTRGKLDAKAIQTLEKQLEAVDPEYDPNLIEHIRTRLKGYNAMTDKGLVQYDSILHDILTKVPDNYKGVLKGDLYNQYQRSAKGEEKSATEQKIFGVFTVLDKFHESGGFGETGLDKSGKLPKQDDPAFGAKYAANLKSLAEWKDAKNHMEHWINDPKHENASNQEISQELKATLDRHSLNTTADRRAEVERLNLEAQQDYNFFMWKEPSAGYQDPQTKQILEREKAEPFGFPKPEAKPTSALDTHSVGVVTGYRPGGGASMGLSARVEGGVKDAHGNVILGKTTMEDYQAGRGDYVTVAMDRTSPWQGKHLVSPNYPGVVFKVMDNGGYGNYKTGKNWIDIAWTDPEKAKAFKRRDLTFHVITAKQAKEVAADRA